MYEDLLDNADIKTFNIVANNLVMDLMKVIIESNNVLLSHDVLNKFIPYDIMKTEYLKVINSFSIYVEKMDKLSFDMTTQNLLPFLDILYPFRKIFRESGHLGELLNLKLTIADFGVSGKALLKDFLGVKSKNTFDNAIMNYASYMGTFQLLEPFDINSYIKLRKVRNVLKVDINRDWDDKLDIYRVDSIFCMGSNETRVLAMLYGSVFNNWMYIEVFLLFLEE